VESSKALKNYQLEKNENAKDKNTTKLAKEIKNDTNSIYKNKQ
jgi:hypothetical protein